MTFDQNFDWEKGAASTLGWWHEAGVEWLTVEQPRNWLALPAERAANPPGADVSRRDASPVAPATPAALRLPETLTAFAPWRLSDDAPDAALSGERIGAAGAATAPLMVVIDTPGREDAVVGQLLSGPAGRLFERMMAAIGLSRDDIYLVPMCVVRPAAARLAPEMEEALGAVLRHHVGLVAPPRLLIMANAPSRALLGTDIAAARGCLRVVNHAGGQSGAVATFHPRFLVERPAAKAEAWKDLQLLLPGGDR